MSGEGSALPLQSALFGGLRLGMNEGEGSRSGLHIPTVPGFGGSCRGLHPGGARLGALSDTLHTEGWAGGAVRAAEGRCLPQAQRCRAARGASLRSWVRDPEALRDLKERLQSCGHCRYHGAVGRQGGITTLLGSGPGAKAVVKSTAQHQEAAFSRRGAEGRCSHGAAP